MNIVTGMFIRSLKAVYMRIQRVKRTSHFSFYACHFIHYTLGWGDHVEQSCVEQAWSKRGVEAWPNPGNLILRPSGGLLPTCLGPAYPNAGDLCPHLRFTKGGHTVQWPGYRLNFFYPYKVMSISSWNSPLCKRSTPYTHLDWAL